PAGPAQNLAPGVRLRHPTRMPPRLARLTRTAWLISGALGATALLLSACDKGHGIVSLSATAPAGKHTQPVPDGPRLGAVAMAAPIFTNPDRHSPKLGYLRAGGTVVRGQEPASHDDCEGGWYRVLPVGYICAASEATTDVNHPLLRALTR